MFHQIKDLPYGYDALEPVIDQKTMEIHHDKHYAGYVEKLNAALEKFPELADKTIEDLLKNLNEAPEEIRTAVKNNGGGAVNHEIYWDLLKKDAPIGGEILTAIEKKFGGLPEFKKQFSDVSAKFFGSGWAWLVVSGGELEIMITVGHDSPIALSKQPVLVLDLWEHSYYLKHQNRRPEYIEAFWSIINWEVVNENYNKAITM